MSKRSSDHRNSKLNQIEEDVETFDYNIKGIRRQHKKKVAKFKKEDKWHEDSF